MMMTIKRIIPACFFACTLLLPRPVQCQERDYQSWYELGLDHRFSNGLNLSGEIGQRFRNKFIQYDRTLVTISAGYDLNDYLEVGVGFRALVRSNKEFELRTGYRVHADAVVSPGWSRTNVSLRNRLQYGFDEWIDLQDAGANNMSYRTRLRVDHHFFGSRVSPDIYLESYYAITGRSDRKFYRIRYSAGLGYKIDFRSDLSFRYILEQEINVSNPDRIHILVLGFSYRL